jgi:hypothetical protein
MSALGIFFNEIYPVAKICFFMWGGKGDNEDYKLVQTVQ